MTEIECLLAELDRWRDPAYVHAGHEQVATALESPEHQQIASRLRWALRTCPPQTPDLPLPAPC